MAKKKYFVAAAVVLTILTVAVLARAVYRREMVRFRNEAGYRVFANILEESRKAPDFALKDLQGRVVKLSDFRGKALFVSFRTTW